jgi:hypothetical protein
VVFASFIFIIGEKNILYFFYDIFVIYVIFSSITTFAILRVSKKECKYILYFWHLYIILYLLGSINPSFYSNFESMGSRYMGITAGANLSSSIIMIGIIYIWEYYKKNEKKINISWLIVVLIFILIVYISKSRTLLFLLPYLIYQVKFLKNKTFIVLAIIIFLTIFLPVYIDTITQAIRLIEDSSFNTRLSIYNFFWELIKNDFYITPHGSGSSRTIMQYLVGDNRYPIHNDLLKYWYEWGLFFFMIIFFIIKRLRVYLTLNNILIFLFVLSTSLHNILFSVYIWLPIIGIFALQRMTRDNETATDKNRQEKIF